MSSNYFDKFPLINYKGVVSRNVLLRAKLKDIVKNQATAFYPYVVKEGEKPDHIAYNYYGSTNYTWLVLLSNEIVDPQFQWYLSTTEFERYIRKKYGSIAAAQADIRFKKKDDILYSPDTAVAGASIVSAYDIESEHNDTHREIKLLNRVYLSQVTDNLGKILKSSGDSIVTKQPNITIVNP